MLRPELPIEALPAWAVLNDVRFAGVEIAETEGRGLGLVSDRPLSTAEDASDAPAAPMISVPHGLVLGKEAVELHAKEDSNFRQLLDVVGRQSARIDALLFLLVQLARASRASHPLAGVSNPWTEYTKFLPGQVPVPTLWTSTERQLLEGTSLKAAVVAKLSALASEFDAVREKSSDLPFWNGVLWEAGTVQLEDWVLLDAWYRSRSLELPRSGAAMVPCIDMVNHSASPTAYYDQDSEGNVTLLTRPGANLLRGDEVTISYGADKSAAEMLFSYGFLDPTSANRSLTLPLEPFPDDPLSRAKLVAFGKQPKVHVQVGGEGAIEWSSPFAYFMCVNEEDGLGFRVLQDTQGTRQLRVLWMDDDVTDRMQDFESVIGDHPLSAVLKLRVVTVIQDCLNTHLQRMQSTASIDASLGSEPPGLRTECRRAARLLRDLESETLEGAMEQLEGQKDALAQDKHVVSYLGSMDVAESDVVGQEASNEEDGSS